jgi:hypothetical protein
VVEGVDHWTMAGTLGGAAFFTFFAATIFASIAFTSY